MISFGPELATDLTAIEAVPAALPNAGGAAPVAGADADLFNAMLGQMMGQDATALDGAIDEDTLDASFDGERDASADYDPTELVNPSMVDGLAPAVQLAPVATLVWTIQTPQGGDVTGGAPLMPSAAAMMTVPAPLMTDPTPASTSTFNGTAVSGSNTFAAVDVPPGMPVPVDTPPSSLTTTSSASPSPEASPSIEPRIGDAAVAPNAINPRAMDAKATPAPVDAPESVPVAPLVSRTTAPSAPGIAEATESQAKAAFGPQIADALNKAERPTRAAKSEKAPVEPKIDPAGIKPLPFVAVERAYAGNESGMAKSFDAPKEQPAVASLSSSSQPAGIPAFVVPADTRTMLNAPPTAAPTATVDIPAGMARDIDTHVPSQIVQSIRLQANNGGGEAIIRLNPNYLGEVVIAVKVEQGSVMASLQAETPAVRQWAERNESVLRQALAEQGLQLDKLTVAEKASEAEREGAHEGAREDAREEQQRQQPRRRRPQSDEATFEVTV